MTRLEIGVGFHRLQNCCQRTIAACRLFDGTDFLLFGYQLGVGIICRKKAGKWPRSARNRLAVLEVPAVCRPHVEIWVGCPDTRKTHESGIISGPPR